MKIFKKIFASAIGAVIAVSMFSGVSAAAEDDNFWQVTSVSEFSSSPEGYEKFSGAELYNAHKEQFGKYYLCYRSVDNPALFAACYRYYFSALYLDKANDGWKEIYDKYRDMLGMDSAVESENGNQIYIRDEVLINGMTSDEISSAVEKRYSAISEKYQIIKEMCFEMYDAGCISSAKYIPFSARCIPLATRNIKVSGYKGEPAVIESIIHEVNSDVRIIEPYYDGDMYVDEYRILFSYDGASAEEYFEVLDVLESAKDELGIEIEADILVREEYSEYSVPDVSVKEIDILSELNAAPAILYGDLSLDGRVGIADAVIMNKHINGSVTFNADQQKAADLDANGEVNTDDLFVLMQYLVSIIDTFPAAE